ncbi:multidrug effflux MFS transporter [Rhodopila sp.]|jgi:DHA1 family bicyclomycin/chloramphenicol resistance-like MFS transporter|uniref:multidrug effflux MFS transporter n=1 Tax=Rhodopila sp. TaxID=2480087 RepID=UPI002BA50A8B|nr:multidrug effflux MFS transporter [Rhodopila sp.]HVZ09291.1 multidrug effflux MFS transporter [Rhodopila sp.]
MSLLTNPLLRGSARAPFLLLVAMTACGTLGMHVIIPALPAMAVALSMSESAAQLTITLYLVGLAIGQLAYGPVSDRLGRRPVILAGLALFTAASLVTVFAPSATVLIGARIVQSLGGCAGLVLGRAAVRDGAAPDKAAAQLALLTLVMSMVPAIAPAVGGFLTSWYGWHASFVLLTVIGAATLAACVLRLPETASPATGSRSLLTGYVRLMQSRRFLGYAVGGACSTTAFYGFMSASPFIFERHLQQTPQQIGLYYLLLMGGVALGSLMANRLASRVRSATALRIANGICVTGAVLFAVADMTGQISVVSIVGSVAIFMIGAGMASPFALAGCVSVNPQAIGAASGLYGFFQMTYGMLCTIVAGSWSPGAIYPVVVLLLGSALLGQAAIGVALRAGASGRG